MRVIFYLLILTFCLSSTYAQDLVHKDSIREGATLANIVVTATRNEKQIEVLPVPITVVSREQIEASGLLRLNELLAEQTGLAVTEDHGSGVQIQGLSPDYTLILIDGEPLIGRTAGTLELSRIALADVERIEILKGPSSSLYGSEALAGVINIITKKPKQGWKTTLSGRYGTNQTSDFTADGSYANEKLSVYALLNRYQTGGFDFNPERFGQTVAPFHNYTARFKVAYQLSSRTELDFSSRIFYENQNPSFGIGSEADLLKIVGDGRVQDYNHKLDLRHRFSDSFKSQLRLYHSAYSTNNELREFESGSMYDANFFNQNFLRIESLNEYYHSDAHILTFGGGVVREAVEATRYNDVTPFLSQYLFAQHEWEISPRMNSIIGARFDTHSEYNSQLSPKLALRYELAPWLNLRASVAAGFKAPDFRQLYLNFDNAVVGYAVLGAAELAEGLQRLESQGQIAQMLFPAEQIGNLRAERSWAYNIGAVFTPHQKFSFSINAFHNEVRDLIETQPIAQKQNGQFVFSYLNLNSVFTQGAELESHYTPLKGLRISAGYQYLIAKDRDVIAAIENGEVFKRDSETLRTRRVRADEYGGLFNRSRHSGNLKIFYCESKTGIESSLRAVWRGRYGFGDLNANQILDNDNEYVPGFVTLHAAIAKTFKQKYRLQMGCDNFLNQTNSRLIPTMPGRLWYAALRLQFEGN
ncbi:MAG: TonB-dependent receptor [Bernardetiaceae bacterium]|nr:TonB-dependent receptor [Bernardetiaceae bacterium]